MWKAAAISGLLCFGVALGAGLKVVFVNWPLERESQRELLLRHGLAELGLAYHYFPDGPKNLEELQARFKPGAPVIESIRNGDIVVRWGLRVSLDFPAGTSNTVLAYYIDVPVKGGWVVMADGSPKKMSAEQFTNSPLPDPGWQGNLPK